jgi:thiol:disulfide interchange protein
MSDVSARFLWPRLMIVSGVRGRILTVRHGFDSLASQTAASSRARRMVAVSCLALLWAATPVAGCGQNPDRGPGHPSSWRSFEEAAVRASTSGRSLLIYVQASWCTWCRRLERESLTHPRVQEMLASYYEPVQLDFDDGRSRYRLRDELISPAELARRLRVDRVPGIVVLRANGTYVTRIVGYLGPDALHDALEALRTGEGRPPEME